MDITHFTPTTRLLLRQRITPLINRYEFFAMGLGSDEPGERLAFIEQKRFSFKEKITAWTSDDRAEVSFTLEAEKVLDVRGKYFIRDASGLDIGFLRKAFGASLVRSTWEIHGATGELLFTAREHNQTIAVLRRYGAFLPIIGDVMQLLPFSFEFVGASGALVGTHRRNYRKLRDQYVISTGAEIESCDKRLIMALGVVLDALQSR